MNPQPNVVEEQLTALQKLIDAAIEFIVGYSFQIVGAIIVLIAGFLVARWISNLLLKMCEKKNFDVTLSRFLAGTVRVIILAFTFLIALGKFGITIAPFVAALGALTFGASFALQGPLSNYGAGLSIILTRPFVVGNTITVAGVSGVVHEVKLACTILTNEDGVRITIPNKHIVGEILHNSQENKIVEAVVGVSYDSDPLKAVEVVTKVLHAHPDVVKDPRPQIGIQEFADSSINIGFRYWVPTVKFFQVSYVINAQVFKALQEARINIPFPQRDVHVFSHGVNNAVAGGVSSGGVK